MATMRDVRAYISSHEYVTTIGLCETFGVDGRKAWAILQECINRGWLLPVDRAYFAPPAAGGFPATFEVKPPNEMVARLVDEIIELMRSKNVAMTAADMGYELEREKGDIQKAVKVLRSQVLHRPGSAGGYYGHPPTIYGLDQAAIEVRDAALIAVAADRKKTKELKAKKQAT